MEWWEARGGPQRRLLPGAGLPAVCAAPPPRRPGAGLLHGAPVRALEWVPQLDTGGGWDHLLPHGPAHTNSGPVGCWYQLSADKQVEHVWQDGGLPLLGSSAWEAEDSRQRVGGNF